MSEELIVADIQFPFLEYRSTYKKPITSIWFGKQQGEIISALLEALSPWKVSLENVSWNQAAKNLAETQLTFSIPSLLSTFNVGVGALTISVLNPDWSRASTFVSVFQCGLDALRRGIGQDFQAQQITLGFHVNPGAVPFRGIVSRFVNTKELGSVDAAFFGVSVYYEDYSFVIDGSVSIPRGVFIKIIRNFTAEKKFEEMAAILYKDEEKVLRLLGLKLK